MSDIVIAGLGILGTLLGVRLGKAWERSSANEAWWRETRLSRYSALLAGLNELSDIGIREVSRSSDEGRLHEANKAPDVVARIEHAGAEVRLVGPDSVYGPSIDAREEATDWIGAVHDAAGSAPEGEAVPMPDQTAMWEATARFVQAAQTVLGVPES